MRQFWHILLQECGKLCMLQFFAFSIHFSSNPSFLRRNSKTTWTIVDAGASLGFAQVVCPIFHNMLSLDHKKEVYERFSSNLSIFATKWSFSDGSFSNRSFSDITLVEFEIQDSFSLDTLIDCF